MEIKKTKTFTKVFIAGFVSAFTFGLGISLASNSNAQQASAYYSPGTTYEVTNPSTYYASISDSLTGSSLLDSLQSLNASKRKKTIGYKSMGTSASSSPYVYTDYDPNGTVLTDSKGQKYGTSLASFYTKTNMTSYNKEHVWPNSRGGSYVEADIHMPRPTISAENSNRGNSFYVEGVASSSSGWDPYTAGYSEISRGESARIIFYCMVASSSLHLSDATNISSGSAGYTTTMGKISDMLKWNLEYNVTTYENNRNNGAQYLQGNRNPFIDHPEYACKIWGDFNTTTQGICSSYATAPNTITVTPSSSSIAVGGTTTLTASVDTGSSNVTWSTSNSSVATVSNGVVTGVAAGSATITATSTVDNSVKGTATVTVKSISSLSVSGTPSTTSYTAGQSFNSSGLIVTATYSDSSTANVTSNITWSPDPLTAGTTSVTGSYANKSISVSGLTVTANYTATINKTNSTILSTTGLTSDTAQEYTISDGANSAGTMSILWSVGSYAPSSYDEVTIPANTGKISSNDSTYVKTMTLDLYKYDNISVYADGVEVTGVAGTATSNNSSLVYIFTINSSNWYIQNVTTSYTQNIYSMELEVEVGVSSVAVTGVSLNHSSLSLTAGSNSTLTATVSPSDATNKNVTWSTSNSSVATVDGGVVTAVAAGNATITVTTSDGGHTATCAVTVTALTLSSLSYSGTPSDSSYFTGESFDATGLTVTATYSNSSTANVTSSVIWTPNPLTAGTTSVTGSYTSGGVTKTITVTGITVSNPTLSSIATSGQTTSYSIGGSFSYDGTCTATYTDNSTSIVTPNVDSSSVNMNVAGTYTVTLSFTSGGVTKTTSYSVAVTDAANISGTYTLTSNATSYTTASDAASAEACVSGLESALTVTAQTNMRFYGSPVTTDMMFGGSSTGASMSIDTTDTNYVVSKIVVKCESYLSANISTMTCAGMSKEVSNYYDGSSSNYADFTFYPLSTSFTISTVDSQKRIFVNSIEATIVPLSSGADAYGEIFNDCTTGDCATLSGISDTNWTLLSTVYANADSTIQTSIVNASANASGTAIQEAMYRYDMIVAKYSATNFLGRSTSSQTTSVLANDSAMYVIVFLIVGMSSLAGVAYLLKKKKHQ